MPTREGNGRFRFWCAAFSHSRSSLAAVAWIVLLPPTTSFPVTWAGCLRKEMASVSQESIYSSQSGPAPGNETIRWRRGVSSRDRARLNEAEGDPTAIVEDIPLENASLGPYDVSNLIFNRMIGERTSISILCTVADLAELLARIWCLQQQRCDLLKHQ